MTDRFAVLMSFTKQRPVCLLKMCHKYDADICRNVCLKQRTYRTNQINNINSGHRANNIDKYLLFLASILATAILPSFCAA